MPRTNTSGVSNAGPVEEESVLLASGETAEVNAREPEAPEPLVGEHGPELTEIKPGGRVRKARGERA